MLSIGIDPNSPNLKQDITSLIQKNLDNNSSSSNSISTSKISANSSPKNSFSEVLSKIYTKIIPKLQKENKTFDIDWNFDRKENKRYESLKKCGCFEIIKVS